MVDEITNFATALQYEQVPREVVHQVKRLMIDGLGCALGGFNSDTAQIGRDIAAEVAVTRGGATILGTDQKTPPDLAAFANGIATRYLDFNDTYLSKDICHPSDQIAPVLAAAEAVGAHGREVIVGIVLAYEVHCRLCDAANILTRGWDQGTYGGLASAVAAARVMGLGRLEMAEALRLSATANLSLAATRFETVSMWKGAAMAFASRNSVFATLLARRGMTAPSRAFEGRTGFFEVISGPLQLNPFRDRDAPFRVMESRMKRFPGGYHSQAAIEAALEVRPKLGSLDDIGPITLETYDTAVKHMAGDPQKWVPTTRETADHSLPYLISVALSCGTVGVEHFEERYLSDPVLKTLIRKVEVKATEECNAVSPRGTLNILRVMRVDGKQHTARVLYHRGHPENPMSDEEVEAKFRHLATSVLDSKQIDAVLKNLWRLEDVSSVGGLMAELQVQRARRGI